MKTLSSHHAYDPFVKAVQTSEWAHMQEINHFQTKFDRSAVFKMTPAEKAALATAIRNYPNRNHKPISQTEKS